MSPRLDRSIAEAILGVDTLFGGDVTNPSGTGRFIADAWFSDESLPAAYTHPAASAVRASGHLWTISFSPLGGVGCRSSAIRMPRWRSDSRLPSPIARATRSTVPKRFVTRGMADAVPSALIGRSK